MVAASFRARCDLRLRADPLRGPCEDRSIANHRPRQEMAICGGVRTPWCHCDQSRFRDARRRFFRSGDGSSLVRRVKVHHAELFAVTLPDDFVHFHAGLKFENHKRPLTGRLYHGRQSIAPTSRALLRGHTPTYSKLCRKEIPLNQFWQTRKDLCGSRNTHYGIERFLGSVLD
jgi:hypothetical protein